MKLFFFIGLHARIVVGYKNFVLKVSFRRGSFKKFNFRKAFRIFLHFSIIGWNVHTNIFPIFLLIFKKPISNRVVIEQKSNRLLLFCQLIITLEIIISLYEEGWYFLIWSSTLCTLTLVSIKKKVPPRHQQCSKTGWVFNPDPDS